MNLPVAYYERDFSEFEPLIAEHAISKRYFAKNDVIAGRTSMFKNCYYIIDGSVKLTAIAGYDSEMNITHYGTGMIAPIIFGNDLAFTLEPYLAYIAAEDTEAWEIQPEILAKLAADVPALGQKAIQHLSKVSNLLLTRSVLSRYNSFEKVCGYLSLYLNRQPGQKEDSHILNMSQETFAGIVGISRVQTSKILNQLSCEGIVRLGNRKIEILNVKRLQDSAPDFLRTESAEDLGKENF